MNTLRKLALETARNAAQAVGMDPSEARIAQLILVAQLQTSKDTYTFSLKDADQRAIASTLAPVFATETGLPPYAYKRNSTRALALDRSSYIWARNLLANRLYRCPVIFLEPYVMNSNEVHTRIQAGDYEGNKFILGKQRSSIYREYADAVTRGLTTYYRSRRTP